LNKVLLDTDMLSEVYKGIDPRVARNATAYRAAFGQYTFSVITALEIVHGFQQARAARRLQGFLASITAEEVLPVDLPTAELAGRIAGELDRTGQTIGMADPLIAATALRHGLALASGNTAHFVRIQQLGYPLLLENWRT
jgi:tRNA(fMet)-specific endonuclease VapC